MNGTTENLSVKILATGGYVPGDPIDNAALEKIVGPLPDDVLEGIQVETRHWMIDTVTGEHLTSNSRMAEAAGRQALERAGVGAAEIDLLVVCTASPEYLLPNVATTVQHYLGLERCAAIEVRGACAGWVQALDIARRQLADGTARTALVIGSEAISPLMAPMFIDKDPFKVRMRERLTLYTFGDGAGAVLMRAEPAEAGHQDDFAFVNACMGGLRKPGMEIIGGGTDVSQAQQLRRKRLIDMKVDVPGTTTFGPRVFVAAIQDMAERSGWSLSDLDALVLPEGNADYFAREYEDAGLSAADDAALRGGKIVENLAEVGATGSAAVPLALDAAWTSGRIQPGHKVVLLGIEASRYVYTGLSLTWRTPAPAPAAA